MPIQDELGRVQLLSQKFLTQKYLGTCRVLNNVQAKKANFPILGFCIGSEDRSLPTVGLFGGVHGLERIGAHVVIAFLERLVTQLEWDSVFRDRFKNIRIVAIPIVNPGGIALGKRSNPRGVDLMRNGPQDAEVRTPFLVGGHRVGPWLPWYRGEKDAPMEVESQALVNFVKEEMFPSACSIAMDFHSGFGLRDRLWYPYGKSHKPFSRLGELEKLKGILDVTFPYHVYHWEQQSASYCLNGDLWDHLFDESVANAPKENLFIPLTLEMGSWLWVKKNPQQIFSLAGPFNPIQPHRHKRILRRHHFLLEFLMSAVQNRNAWAQETKAQEIKVREVTENLR